MIRNVLLPLRFFLYVERSLVERQNFVHHAHDLIPVLVSCIEVLWKPINLRAGTAVYTAFTHVYCLVYSCSSLTRVTKSNLSALGTTQISSYITKH